MRSTGTSISASSSIAAGVSKSSSSGADETFVAVDLVHSPVLVDDLDARNVDDVSVGRATKPSVLLSIVCVERALGLDARG